MKREPILTTINGHEYRCEPFGFDTGQALMLELADIVLSSLGEAGALVDFDLGALSSLEALASLNWGALGKGIGAIPKAILTRGGPQLVSRFLAKTRRCFPPEDARGKERWEPLATTEARDQAFDSYVEGFEVVTWVVKENFGPFWTELFGRLPQPATKPGESKKAEGTEAPNP
ncbi:MAG: hypothetical protein WCS88_04120 [Patescibacteria group bacterium]